MPAVNGIDYALPIADWHKDQSATTIANSQSLRYDWSMTVNHNQRERAERFQELHQSGCFVLPNPWDAGSAVYLEELGFKAIASTSAGFAYSRALPDSPHEVPVDRKSTR